MRTMWVPLVAARYRTIELNGIRYLDVEGTKTLKGGRFLLLRNYH